MESRKKRVYERDDAKKEGKKGDSEINRIHTDTQKTLISSLFSPPSIHLKDCKKTHVGKRMLNLKWRMWDVCLKHLKLSGAVLTPNEL